MATWKINRLEVGEFFLYRLWRDELSAVDYSSFIGWRKHIQSLLSLNPIQYRCLTENKLVFYHCCSSLSIPTPRVYAIYDSTIDHAFNSQIIGSFDELTAFLRTHQIRDMVVKPTDGTRGQSIMALIFDADTSCFYSPDGAKVNPDDIRGTLKGYDYNNTIQTNFIIQQRLHPHPDTNMISSFCPFSYRATTLLTENCVPHIIAVYAKAAIGNNYTDNRSAKGLTCLLDKDGICIGARSIETKDTLLDYHPTSGFKLKGWKPPFFSEVCKLAIDAATKFFQVRCVAWDIIAADEGLFIIEGNNPWNKGIQEIYDRGLWQGIFREETERAIGRGPAKSPWW